ncbi:MAG: HigA family addiction module antidote protein [Bacteroidales bacterium]|nr:HigA family addiction module antidote protein [Candidatus Sodaliphilus fimicaballi]
METNNTTFMAIHPGEVLREELKERGITQKAFADMIGMRASHLNELINGKRSITITIADKLEKALGIDSISWMNLQTQYNYDIKATKTASDKTVTLEVSVEDTTMLAEIKRAISMIRGVKHVALL